MNPPHIATDYNIIICTITKHIHITMIMSKVSDDEEHLKQRTTSGVCFGSVHVRCYYRTLGDNPSVSSGPPLSLSWEYDVDSSMYCSVEEWEKGKEPRTRSQFRMPEEVRTSLLIEEGYAPSQIRDAISIIQKEQKMRSSYYQQDELNRRKDDMIAVSENIRRRLARFLGVRDSSDILYKQWIASQAQGTKISKRRRATVEGTSSIMRKLGSYTRRQSV